MKPLHGDAEHWFDECTKLIAERDQLAAENKRLLDQVASMKSALLAAEKAILRLQAEVPMSNRICAQATKARCAAKKAALSGSKEVV